MNSVIDRPRIVAETSKVPGAGAVLTPDALDLVAELHGGTLSARSKKRGTTIVAVVPRTATGDTLSYLS